MAVQVCDGRLAGLDDVGRGEAGNKKNWNAWYAAWLL
jgi:hypothetical protein